MEAVVLKSGDGERHSMSGSTVVVKASGARAGDLCFFAEAELAPGFKGFPPHRHERTSEVFFVLEGTLCVQLGDETHAVQAGGYACASPGVLHTFSNPYAERVRFLNLRRNPAEWDAFLDDLKGAKQAGSLTPEHGQEISTRYDIFLGR